MAMMCDVELPAAHPNIRADVIRQFYERGDNGMVEVLTDLEADELARLQVIEALRRLNG